MWTWADVCWYCGPTVGIRDHPIRSIPIVPSSAFGMLNNWWPRDQRPHQFDRVRSACGYLGKNWNDLWMALRPSIQAKLRTIPHSFAPVPDRSTSRLNPRPHDRPFEYEPAYFDFPWHLLTHGGIPLAQYTVKAGRTTLASTEPVKPDWTFEASEQEWRRAWHCVGKFFTSSACRSDLVLSMHCRVWLAQQPRGARHAEAILDPHALEPELVVEQGPLPLDREGDPDIEEDDKPRAGDVNLCMSGCEGIRDSAAHGYVLCPTVQDFWTACLPILASLVGHRRPPPLDVRSIVLGRPGLPMPRALRSRLLLWRAAVTHRIARHRHSAIATGLRANRRGCLPEFDAALPEVRRDIADWLLTKFTSLPEAARVPFLATYGEGGSFWKANGPFFCLV